MADCNEVSSSSQFYLVNSQFTLRVSFALLVLYNEDSSANNLLSSAINLLFFSGEGDLLEIPSVPFCSPAINCSLPKIFAGRAFVCQVPPLCTIGKFWILGIL